MSNFPERPRHPFSDVPLPNNIGFILSEDMDQIKSIFQTSKTPEDYDKFIAWKKEQEKRFKYYEKELQLIETKCDKPAASFPDKYLWRRLIDLTVEMEWWGLLQNQENEIVRVAKKLALRGPSQNTRINFNSPSQ